ncbi:hypothetical protein [Phenylobacterium sp.]|uniref:hypothetical protein n=1 Tax=Phenylobacterium sp. TaxID=1871053 RepID=UPI0025FD89E1|nr:hypothetical protein [Phenylobacterium sp.]
MHPAVLTPERIDAMLSCTAEICMAGVEEAGARLKAAPDAEAFERTGRTLNTVCRNLRQIIAMKLRFDREQAGIAVERRHAAEVEHQDAERVRNTAVIRHRGQVRRHFQRVLWAEYEPDDAQEVFNDLDDRLGDLAEDAAFLDTPIEILIARLAEELDLVPAEAGAPEDEAAAPPVPAMAEEASAPDEETPAEAPDPVETIPPPSLEAAPPPEPAPPDPPPPDPPPPEPPPEPYLMPWERGIRDPRGSFGWMS